MSSQPCFPLFLFFCSSLLSATWLFTSVLHRDPHFSLPHGSFSTAAALALLCNAGLSSLPEVHPVCHAWILQFFLFKRPVDTQNTSADDFKSQNYPTFWGFAIPLWSKSYECHSTAFLLAAPSRARTLPPLNHPLADVLRGNLLGCSRPFF